MLKLVSWNMAHRAESWRTLLNSDIDVALLQEAARPPADLTDKIDCELDPWQTEGAGATLRYRTSVAGLNRGVRVEHITTAPLAHARSGDLPVSRLGSIASAHEEDPVTRERYILVSMYAAWERPHPSTGSRWIVADASAHRLISDLSALVGHERGHRIVAAGDFNLLYGYGESGSLYWAARYRTVFERLAAIGLKFVGPQAPNGRRADPRPTELPAESNNVPTYYGNRRSPASATRQLDFVFASTDIASTVNTRALNSVEEWGPSDHCQIRIEVG